jgi:hypothetical protein
VEAYSLEQRIFNTDRCLPTAIQLMCL